MTMRLPAALLALAVTAGLLLSSGPASAAPSVQTRTFALDAAPASGGAYRTTIAHPANGATVRDRIEVTNRTAGTITVSLGVVSADRRGASVLVGQTPNAPARRVELKVDRITLKAHQQASIPVTIRTPRGASSDQLAAITASSGTTGSGTVAVAERLALLIDLTPTTRLVPERNHLLLYLGGILVLLLLLVLAFLLFRRRDRGTRSPKKAATAG